MQSQETNSFRLYLFAGIVLLSLLVAGIYVVRAAMRPQLAAPETILEDITGGDVGSASSPLASPLPTTSVLTLDQLTHRPFLISLNVNQGPDIGKVQVAALDAPDGDKVLTGLRCERVYFAGGRGICLRREIDNLSARTLATFFDDTFRAQLPFRTDGIPSRARVSPDGRYAVLTAFVLGHSYADNNFSTATILLDAQTGVSLGNLEEFTVYQDGVQIDYPDFNYWGVTFSQDGNTFYATLRYNLTPYLVRGNIQERTVSVLKEGVECPSLSPDETRVAFKKMIGAGYWQLTVMDLKSFVETPLAETGSVDDQAEWLDNDHVLYGLANASPPPLDSVFVVPADGSGEPTLFLEAATSPAVVQAP
ncbi:MAG: hypothetical protein KDE46_04155 [Caldilineaceae bacterium]|nr:hypothetical protein [Caldilineaceae bacterium]